MSIAHLLNQTADWKRNIPVGDHGRFVLTPVLIQASLPVRKRIAGASDQTVGFREKAEASHVVYTEPEIDLLRDDLLYIDGIRYDVISGLPPSVPPGEEPHHMKWMVQQEQRSTEVVV